MDFVLSILEDTRRELYRWAEQHDVPEARDAARQAIVLMWDVDDAMRATEHEEAAEELPF
jgi:hypothetical protein